MGRKWLPVDVRVLAATNKDLEEEIKNNNFREDLYYRLKVIHVKTPPLREIRIDIPLLANHFLSLYCKEMGKGEKEFSPGAMESLANYQWPGNVRELENEMKRLVVSIRKKVLDREHLSDNIRKSVRIDRKASHSLKDVVSETVEELEKEMILGRSGGLPEQSAPCRSPLGTEPPGLIQEDQTIRFKIAEINSPSSVGVPAFVSSTISHILPPCPVALHGFPIPRSVRLA